MKKKKVQTLQDFKDLCEFLAVNAHNLLLDSYIPGEKVDTAAQFMKTCKTVATQLQEEKNEH